MITITVDDRGFVAELDRLTAELRQPTALAAVLQRELSGRLRHMGVPSDSPAHGVAAAKSVRSRTGRKPGSAFTKAVRSLVHHGSPLRLQPVLPKGGRRETGTSKPRALGVTDRVALTRLLVRRADQYLNQLIA